MFSWEENGVRYYPNREILELAVKYAGLPDGEWDAPGKAYIDANCGVHMPNAEANMSEKELENLNKARLTRKRKAEGQHLLQCPYIKDNHERCKNKCRDPNAKDC